MKNKKTTRSRASKIKRIRAKKDKKKFKGGKKAKDFLSLVAGFLKIISEAKRLKILKKLKPRKGAARKVKEISASEIQGHLRLPQNLTSHHLKTLKNFRLLSNRKEGTKVFYRLNKKAIRKYLDMLNGLLK